MLGFGFGVFFECKFFRVLGFYKFGRSDVNLGLCSIIKCSCDAELVGEREGGF